MEEGSAESIMQLSEKTEMMRYGVRKHLFGTPAPMHNMIAEDHEMTQRKDIKIEFFFN